MSFGGFPKALSYAFDRLDGFSKITQRVEPNRINDVKSGSTIKVAIEPNTLWGLRSLCMYYDFTVNKVGNTATDGYAQARYAPRLSSSIIDTIAIYMNNYQVDNCMDYNLLYNTLYDFSAGGDQVNKRFLENADPSVKYIETLGASGSTLTSVNTNKTMSATDYSDTARTFVINNFINFLGNSGVEYLDTNDTGLTEISIRLAPTSVCWKAGAGANAVAVPTTAQYQLDNIYFTYSKLVFKDTLYEEIKHSLLMNESGLRIKFTSYETHIGPLQSRNINYSFSTNASSLDTIICTTRRTDYADENYLQLTGAADGTTSATEFSFNVATGETDLFNQSMYFRRDMSGIMGSQLFINGTSMSQRPLTPAEIYTETAIALNDHNDLSNSCHKGLYSLASFLKYYFAHILSLNYTGDVPTPTISGLNGQGASFTILWKTTANGTVTSQVYPVVFTASSRVLVVNAQRQISIEI